MKIAIYGLGYVGLTAAACLTKEGHTVLGVDVSDSKVREVNAGHSPIEEPGLAELLRAAIDRTLLRAVNDAAGEINDCDLAIVCVGTPSAQDGSHNLSYIAEVTRQIAVSIDPARTSPLTVVYRSTIRPGTVDTIIRPIFRSTLKKHLDAVVEIIYNPEFLREATAIKDYFAPPKIVIGTHDGHPSRRMDELNKNIDAPVFYTKYGEAEFTKFVDNNFHALKVAFGNEIGRISVQLGIDPAKVHEIFVSDTKLNISSRYFRPGGAFGGSCLPKDVRALQYIAMDVGARTQIIESLIQSNEAHKAFLFNIVTRGLTQGASILLLGLAFKAESDDLRESPKVDLARKLLQSGYRLQIYDPWLKPERLVGQNLGYGVSRLPDLPDLLVDKERAEQGQYDLVVDASGMAKDLRLASRQLLDINSLS